MLHGTDHLESIPAITEEKKLRRRPAAALFVMIGAHARATGCQKQFRVMSMDVCTGHDLPQRSQHRAGFPLETNLEGPSAGAARDTVPSSEFQAESIKQGMRSPSFISSL
jgi:hypothetical protein